MQLEGRAVTGTDHTWRPQGQECLENLFTSTYAVVIAGANLCHFYFHIHYLLSPWCSVLPEQLPGLQLLKKFPAFHGTRMFITVLTSVRHLSLPLASPIQSIYPHPTSCRSTLILSTHLHLGLPSGLLLTYCMVHSPS